MEALTHDDVKQGTLMFSDNVKIVHRECYFCCVIKQGRPVAKVYGPTPEKCKAQAELIIRLLNDEEKRTESNCQPENNRSDGPIQE